jgi:hypothetical protein
MRWPVERTNSWFSNFGQLRRNTDRLEAQCLGQIALAVVLILTVKLLKGLLQVWLTLHLWDVVLQEGCQRAQEVPAGVQA